MNRHGFIFISDLVTLFVHLAIKVKRNRSKLPLNLFETFSRYTNNRLQSFQLLPVRYHQYGGIQSKTDSPKIIHKI